MSSEWSRRKTVLGTTTAALVIAGVAAASWGLNADRNPALERGSDFTRFSAPAGQRPATANTVVDGVSAAVLPNGRLVTPAGTEVSLTAPKPFGLALSPDDRTLFVTHVGVFQYTHLRPPSPTGNDNIDFPLCYPGAGYPTETRRDRQISVTRVDPRNLPDDLRDPDGIRCGYVPQDTTFTVPGLGSPNAPQSSSVYVLDVTTPAAPRRVDIVKTGPLVGERQHGIDAYSGSHPNSVVVGRQAIYVANGNNDSISILDKRSFEERDRIALSPLRGSDRSLRGVQPVGLALSPDGRYLYVAEAGVNAVGVIALHERGGRVVGYIPTGWWPSAVEVSADGRTLYVANARGRGATPNGVGESQSPKFTVIGTVNITRCLPNVSSTRSPSASS
jgi:DNA-binding beta-propeller fold protein YncE